VSGFRIKEASLTDRRVSLGESSRRKRCLAPGWRGTAVIADFTIQFIQRGHDPLEHFVTARCETVHAGTFGAPRLGCTEPSALRHAGQHRIERARTQVIAVMVQFLEHPLTVDALTGRVVKDVDLPEHEQELTDDRVAHDPAIITSPFVIGFRLFQRVDIVATLTISL
jgi:hypothetical protein